MPKLAILIPGSATPAFYSQIAAFSLALGKLAWRRWEPSIHAFFGQNPVGEDPDFPRWSPHLTEVEIFRVSRKRELAMGNWAQVDDTLRLAPRDADVLMSMDADTLPVASFEDMLDDVRSMDAIAGAIAHLPFPGKGSSQEKWARIAEGLIDQPLEFRHAHSLLAPTARPEHRLAPFYVNGGVIAYARASFERFVPRYLALRDQLTTRLEYPDFAGQAAVTLAITEQRIPTIELPLRYNFPNDPRAEQLHPVELENAVIFHYLRHTAFDRHRIFATPQDYAEFLSLPLEGANRIFQSKVRSLFGADFPFA